MSSSDSEDDVSFEDISKEELYEFLLDLMYEEADIPEILFLGRGPKSQYETADEKVETLESRWSTPGYQREDLLPILGESDTFKQDEGKKPDDPKAPLWWLNIQEVLWLEYESIPCVASNEYADYDDGVGVYHMRGHFIMEIRDVKDKTYFVSVNSDIKKGCPSCNGNTTRDCKLYYSTDLKALCQFVFMNETLENLTANILAKRSKNV